MNGEAGQHTMTPSPIGLRQLIWAPLLGSAVGLALAIAVTTGWMMYALSGMRLNVGAAAGALQSSFDANMAIIAVVYLPTIAFLWHAAGKLTPAPAVRFFKAVSSRIVLLALATGVAVSFACMGLEALLSSVFGISFELTAAERALLPSTPVQLAIAVAVMGFIGPFAEEIYFRGFLLQWLRQHMGIMPSVLVSAATFGLVHFFMLLHPGASGWITTGEIFAVGVVMGVWVVRTGSLWTSFAVHVGYNCIVVMQTFLPN